VLVEQVVVAQEILLAQERLELQILAVEAEVQVVVQGWLAVLA
jgi:hypothetical protein